MINLKNEDRQQLIALLKDIPELSNERSRQQFLIEAGLTPLLPRLDLSGSPFTAISEIITKLSSYGRLSDNREALGVFLNALKIFDTVGVQQQQSKPDSRQPNLFAPFCGFKPDFGFKSSLVIDEQITRTLNYSDINEVIRIEDWNERVDAAVALYYRQAKFLAQNRVVDVIVCIVPTKLYDKIYKPKVVSREESLENEQEQHDDILEANFRRALKARTMHLGKPLQLVREVSLESNLKGQQDEATKAWNFCTALYYKTNQTVPWKLSTNINHSNSRHPEQNRGRSNPSAL
ncbi:MAG: hypothetical protein RLP02_38815 [Coleofasciculus sp. C2-GNP5-27]